MPKHTPKFPVGSRVTVNVDGDDTPATKASEQAWRAEWRDQVGMVEDFDVVEDFYTIRWDNNSPAKIWTDTYLVLVALPTDDEPPARPTVCLKAKGQHTALEYAQWFPSRVIDEPHNGVLKALAAGEVVDAVAAQVALQYALSSVSHRFGQSMVRRAKAREVRHVLHIVNAIIAAHIDGLPAYDSEAARSRAVAEVKAAEAETYAALQEARGERDALAKAVEEATEALAAQTATIEALVAERDDARVLLHNAESDRTVLRKVVRYASMLIANHNSTDVGRLRGYEDGLRA